MELTNAKNQIALQESNIQSRKDQLSLAEKIYGQVRQQFNEGLINITEVLQSDNSLREAQNNYLVSLVNLLNAQLSWKKAAGKLLNY
jgi:outer membrane protein TolC